MLLETLQLLFAALRQTHKSRVSSIERTQQFVDLQMTSVAVAILRILNQEYATLALSLH